MTRARRSRFHGVLQVYRFAIRYWPAIGLTIACMAAFASAEGYYLYLMRPFLDAFGDLLKRRGAAGLPADLHALYAVGERAILLAPVVGALALAKELLTGWVIWRLVADLRNAICTALLPQSLQFFEDRRSGDLMSRITNDVGRSQMAFQMIFESIPEDFFHFLMGVIIAVIYGKEFLLAALVVVPVVVVPVGYLAQRIRRYGRESLQKLSDLTDLMSQMFAGIRVIKAFKMEDAEAQEFQRVNEKFLSKMVKVAKMRGFSSGTLEVIVRGFIGAAIILSVWLVSRGILDLTPGAVVISIGGIYYSFNSLRKLVKSYNRLHETIPAADRILELVQHPPALQDDPNARPLPRIQESIAFCNVSFAYDSEPVLRNITFEVKPGQRIAIVGKSGAGKSTLVALLMRFYDPTEGCVAFDGVDIRHVTRSSLLDHFAIVSQQTFLFNRTIGENIRYGRRDATQEEVERAARLANIHDFIVSLPEGYDTLCGEFGAKLSGGQRQRIAIARAILKDPDILILDEAMVGLDSESEAAVRSALENLMRGRTTFVVTHDIATIRDADRILVLKDGRLLAEGTHEDLMRDCEEYRVLYGLQV